MKMNSASANSRRQGGFSLIEVMVGIVIALIAVLVIYQVFNVAEGIKRNTTGAGDAQQNGLLSAFTMMLQFSNAGANIAVVGDELDACPFVNDIKTTLRPIPVLITAGADDATSDSFVVNYGASERLVTSVNFASAPTIDPGADYKVQSPLGFKKGDVVVLISSDSGGAGRCGLSVITGDVAAADSDGYVSLAHSVPTDPDTSAYNGNAALLNLGPAPRRVQFDVDTNGTLRSTDLIDSPPPAPDSPFTSAPTVPISNNIVLMKVQYGIADPATGFLQKWVKATNADEDWSANAMLNTKTFVDLSRVKAVRIALIVRSESYDKCAYADVCPGATTNAFAYKLFEQCDGITCPAALEGTIDPTPGLGNFRYRVYETVIPLRNAVWNLHKAT